MFLQITSKHKEHVYSSSAPPPPPHGLCPNILFLFSIQVYITMSTVTFCSSERAPKSECTNNTNCPIFRSQSYTVYRYYMSQQVTYSCPSTRRPLGVLRRFKGELLHCSQLHEGVVDGGERWANWETRIYEGDLSYSII